MRLTLLLAAILLSACSPRQGFISPCGAALVMDDHPYPIASDYVNQSNPDDWYVWTQDDFNAAESLSIAGLDHINTLMAPESLCRRLSTVTVIQEPNPVWVDPWKRSVAGLTDCFKSTIWIGTGVFDVNAYTHELAHLAQSCNAPKPVDEHLDEDHSNWNRDGIYDAISKTMGYAGGIH